MKIRKTICIVLSIVLISLAAACGSGSGGSVSDPSAVAPPSGGSGGSGGTHTPEPSPSGGGSSTNLTGTPGEILGKLVDDIAATGAFMPMSLPPSEVTPDLSHNTMGLSEADFNRLVASAYFNLAAIGTFAHQIIVVQANDARAATDIKNIVSGPNGYDPQKWVCVWPERVIAVESGEYVLIVASYNEVVDAAIEAFREAAGTIGTVNTFFEHAGGDGGVEVGGGGGMAPLPIP